MPFWPFGRKSRKSSTTVETSSADAGEKALEATSRDLDTSMAAGRIASRKDSQRRKHDASQALSKAQQTAARDPEKESPSQPRAIPVQKAANSRRQQYANEKSSLPPDVRKQLDPTSMSPNRGDIPPYYFQDPTSHSSLQPENFTALKRPPTLRAKRSANESNLPRRKSSKRKAEDHAREQVIKAMSSENPITKGRPVSQSGGPLRRDTKRIHGGLNRRLERPTSDVSLPLPESMHSSASEASEQRAFKVRSLDVFTPRPTIRCSDGSRYATGSSSLGPSRASTRREKRPTIPDEVIKQGKRIEDLADDMDATGLRELMERDRRRREKKRQRDLEKLQRKLQRRADKQKKEAKAGMERTGNMSNKDIERGVLGREEAGVGTDEPVSPRVDETIPFIRDREEARESPDSWLQDPSKEHLPPENPFVDPTKEGDVPRTDEPTPAEELEEPVIGTANVVRLSQASMSPPTSPREQIRGPSNISAVADLARQSTSERPERSNLDRRSSDTSGRAAGSWTSFFRRGGTRGKRHSADRGRITPSEFSNTSRESFARQHPPVAFQRNVRHRSGTPVRTQSKFREDLPELPISPPDSRVQSPEAITLSRSPYPDRTVSPLPETSGVPAGASMADVPLEDIHPAFRQEIAQIRQRTIDAPSPEPGPSSALLSQSLASVDSEGSWLSGRPVKRTSQPAPNRGSIGSLQKRLDDFSNNSDDEDLGIGVAEDEYFNRLHPGRAEHRNSEQLNPPFGHGHRKASSTAMANGSDNSDNEHEHQHDDDDDFDGADGNPRSLPLTLPLPGILPSLPVKDEGTWHSALARQPTIVRHQGVRAKSREGLLNDFLSSAPSQFQSQRHSQHADPSSFDSNPDASDASDDDEASLDQQAAQGPVSVQRATSIDLGTRSGVRGVGRAHARHISAGSAKLLDLPPRTGGGEGGKRLSSGSGTSNPASGNVTRGEGSVRE